MKTKVFPLLAMVLLLMLVVSGCSSDEPDTSATDQAVVATNTPMPTPTEAVATAGPIYGEAPVESIRIMMMESFPVQVNVYVRGNLPDGCTRVDETISTQEGDTFMVTITTVREPDAICTEAEVPFAETIPLAVLGLDAGQYTVDVNGTNGSFTLDMDNRIPDEPQPADEPEPTAVPTPTPEPDDSNSGGINGRVWHDLCAVAEGEETEPSEGCIATADGQGFQANGLMEEGEPGLKGILVSLDEGECPAAGELTTATTDENGDYSFDDLPTGTYCISIDVEIEQNDFILVPGEWTAPDVGVAETAVTLADGESATSIDFGWDYQFLPLPQVDTETCTNIIEFVEDLSIPDDTVFEPGQELVKSWRLRNIGTCSWTTGYSLVFVGGDEIPGPDTLPLPNAVAPGQLIDLSVTLNAPESEGTYRANWQLSDANGELFGVGGFVEEVFWLQIVVAEVVPTPLPNSAAIGGVIWADLCYFLDDGSPFAGCVETEEGSGFYIADGTLNFNESRIPDLVVTLNAGVCPAEEAVPAGDVIATATTDENGLYRFTNLDGGTYCVFIDAFSEANINALIPGDWTWPAPGVGRFTTILDDGEEQLEIDFGWQHYD